MAGMCCEVNLGETKASAPAEPVSRSAGRRSMEIHQFNFVPTDSAVAPPLERRGKRKRQRFETAVVPVLPRRVCEVQREEDEKRNPLPDALEPKAKHLRASAPPPVTVPVPPVTENGVGVVPDYPKFGMTSVCGRRRDMEDAVAIHPSFCGPNPNFPSGMHFFGVYDGHGCSHVSFHPCNYLPLFKHNFGVDY